MNQIVYWKFPTINFYLIESSVDRHDRFSRILPRPQPLRVPAYRRVQVQHLRRPLDDVELRVDLHNDAIVPAPVQMRLVPFRRRGDAEHRPAIRPEQAHGRAAVRQHVIEKPVRAPALRVRAIQLHPMGWDGRDYLRQEPLSVLACWRSSDGRGRLTRPGVQRR